jgi:hypothetical protein
MTDSTEEFYDDAANTFPSKVDLAPDGTFEHGQMGAGRLVAVWAVKNGVGTKDGKSYSYVDSITLVLDDGLDGTYFTELVGPAPQRIEMQHSTGGLVARLKGRVEGRNAKGVSLKYRPMIGRINTQPSKANAAVAAYSISPPTEDDRVVVDGFKKMIIDINQELESRDAEDSDTQAFE